MTHPVEGTLPLQEPPDFQSAWDALLATLKTEMSKTQFETWVKPARPHGFDGGVFHLRVPNENYRLYIINRLQRRMSLLLSGVYEQDVNLEVQVEPPAEPGAPAPSAAGQLARPAGASGSGSTRKMKLQAAYGDARAAIIRPERIIPMTDYLRLHWGPILGGNALWVILAARAMCYWNVDTGEMRNTVDTNMAALAENSLVCVRTLKTILRDENVRRYFIRYKVRRVMTPNGIRTAGITMCVRMDEPLTPYDQETNKLYENDSWSTIPLDEADEDF